MGEWQPISTAPRDGTCILVPRPAYKTLAVAHCYDEKSDDVIDPITGRIWRATHWLPLPPPPKERGDG